MYYTKSLIPIGFIIRIFMTAIFGVFVAYGIANAATIHVEDGCDILLNGEIDSSTPFLLEKAFNSLPIKNNEWCERNPGSWFRVTLRLNSNGGDIDAAMRAGEFVRQKKITTFIYPNATCASACVLLLVGSVDRRMLGNIGLHRPFSESLSMTESESKAKYEKANILIQQYLSRMNIPDALLNMMNSVAPGEIKWLTDEQVKELHLNGVDPVFADQADSKWAKSLGISKKELYSRQQRAKAICIISEASYAAVMRKEECDNDVMHGRR